MPAHLIHEKSESQEPDQPSLLFHQMIKLVSPLHQVANDLNSVAHAADAGYSSQDFFVALILLVVINSHPQTLTITATFAMFVSENAIQQRGFARA